MNVIGLTGGIATGKTTVSHSFKSLNVPIIDADIINRQLLLTEQSGYNEILKLFPDIPLAEDGSLDKHYIRTKIFNHPEIKQQLEQRLHPLIKTEINVQINKLKSSNNDSYCIVSVPLMIEAKFNHLVSKLWVCDCSEKIQLQRLMIRDQLSQEDAQLIINHQLSRQERLQYADEIIPTKNKTQMQEKIKYLHQQQIKLN